MADELAAVTLRSWAEGDLPLLTRLLGDPSMTEHLGGPETPEQLAHRHHRYQTLSAPDRMFVVLLGGTPMGSVGYWGRMWQEQQVLETGWSVLPEFQGQGVAGRALQAAIHRARTDSPLRWLHAFPGTENAASNALCRKAGFEWRGETAFEYPPGHTMRCHDWAFDLWRRT